MSEEESKFSERELKVMSAAFQCLKDGPPQVRHHTSVSMRDAGLILLPQLTGGTRFVDTLAD